MKLICFSLTEEPATEAPSEDEYSALFVIDMHPDLGEPVEQLGIEMEQVMDH